MRAVSEGEGLEGFTADGHYIPTYVKDCGYLGVQGGKVTRVGGEEEGQEGGVEVGKETSGGKHTRIQRIQPHTLLHKAIKQRHRTNMRIV